ncbi:MAG: hypothetical protein U5L72_17980 [Bacteroidales bacterium]|nr:hypothetical protein [Bacteroidales bacterium]
MPETPVYTGIYAGVYQSILLAKGEYQSASLTMERGRADHDYYSHQLDEFNAVKLVQD